MSDVGFGAPGSSLTMVGTTRQWVGAGASRGDLYWQANEDLTLFELGAGPPPPDGGPGLFDGTRRIAVPAPSPPGFATIWQLGVCQRSPGSAGVTAAECWRNRGGLWLLLGTLALGALVPFEVATALSADPVLLDTDILVWRLISVQASAFPLVPTDLSAWVRIVP
jgi:hypothetical protein